MTTKILPLFFCALMACAPIQEAVKTVETGARLAQATEPVVAAAYRAQLQYCAELSDADQIDPCVQKVQDTYEPIRKLYTEFKTQWCALDKLLGGNRCAEGK